MSKNIGPLISSLGNGRWVIKEGDKLVTNKKCTCQSYLHEITYHYRPGLIEKRIEVNQELTLLYYWKNLYGEFLRVNYQGIEYDLLSIELNFKKHD